MWSREFSHEERCAMVGKNNAIRVMCNVFFDPFIARSVNDFSSFSSSLVLLKGLCCVRGDNSATYRSIYSLKEKRGFCSVYGYRKKIFISFYFSTSRFLEKWERKKLWGIYCCWFFFFMYGRDKILRMPYLANN